MLLEKKREENASLAIYPCVCKTLQIINKRNPMIIGLEVVSGSIRIGTPITVVKTENGVKQVLDLGRIQSMEVNHKSIEIVKKGQTNQGVAVRLADPTSYAQPIWEDMLMKRICFIHTFPASLLMFLRTQHSEIVSPRTIGYLLKLETII